LLQEAAVQLVQNHSHDLSLGKTCRQLLFDKHASFVFLKSNRAPRQNSKTGVVAVAAALLVRPNVVARVNNREWSAFCCRLVMFVPRDQESRKLLENSAFSS
jgi:hypothetical protein